MNKLKLETKNICIKDNKDLILEIDDDTELNIDVQENIKANILFLIKSSSVKIQVNLLDNSDVTINQLGINSSIDYNVYLNNNSSLLCIDSILSKVDSINHIKITHQGNFSETRFYTNGINLENKKLYFLLDGIIEQDKNGIFLEENSKIMNLSDGDSKILPNLIVHTKEVIANHSAFIGTFSKDDINYLMSRGIDLDNCKKMLIKSILLSKMELDTTKFLEEISFNMN